MNKDAMRCYDGVPATNAGKRIKNVDKLDCPVKVMEGTTGSHHAVTSTLLTILTRNYELLKKVLVFFKAT